VGAPSATPGGGALVIGESLIDVLAEGASGTGEEVVGGGPLNTAVALARLGRPVRFRTAVGPDARGERILARLAAEGVAVEGDPRTLTRTSTARATIGPDGAARYAFDVAWDLGARDPDAPAGGRADGAPLVVHAASLGALLSPGRERVRATLERLRPGATVVYDVNLRPSAAPAEAARPLVERLARTVDVVRASDEDLEGLYPGLTWEAGAARLLAGGPVAAVVTRGAAGASWIDAGGRVDAAARPARVVVDTVGAGDTFSASLIDALWSLGALGGGRRAALASLGEDAKARALGVAAAAAALVVARRGAQPPSRAELDAALAGPAAAGPPAGPARGRAASAPG